MKKTKPAAKRKASAPDYVTATLPNGQEVNLYGDAVDMIESRRDTDPEWKKLADAVRVIVTSDAAPLGLKNPVIDFLSSSSGDIWGKLMITPPMIVNILVSARIKQEQEADQ